MYMGERGRRVTEEGMYVTLWRRGGNMPRLPRPPSCGTAFAALAANGASKARRDVVHHSIQILFWITAASSRLHASTTTIRDIAT